MRQRVFSKNHGKHVNAGDIAPFFMPPPPANASVDANAELTIPATVYGPTSAGAGFQWFDVNGNAIANASGVFANSGNLNATLTVSNAPAGWNNGTIELVASNAYGTTNIFVTLSVLAAPAITNDIPSHVTLAQGQRGHSERRVETGAVPMERSLGTLQRAVRSHGTA